MPHLLDLNRTGLCTEPWSGPTVRFRTDRVWDTNATFWRPRPAFKREMPPSR